MNGSKCKFDWIAIFGRESLETKFSHFNIIHPTSISFNTNLHLHQDLRETAERRVETAIGSREPARERALSQGKEGQQQQQGKEGKRDEEQAK